jgi:hypothetical protein
MQFVTLTTDAVKDSEDALPLGEHPVDNFGLIKAISLRKGGLIIVGYTNKFRVCSSISPFPELEVLHGGYVWKIVFTLNYQK